MLHPCLNPQRFGPATLKLTCRNPVCFGTTRNAKLPHLVVKSLSSRLRVLFGHRPSSFRAAQAPSPCHAAARCLSELLFSPTPTPECGSYSAQPVHDFSNVDSLDARLTWQPEASRPCSTSSLAAGRFQVSTYGTEKRHTRTQGRSEQESDLIRNHGSRPGELLLTGGREKNWRISESFHRFSSAPVAHLEMR